MTSGLSFRSKVLMVAAANAVLLAAALVWFARTQLTQDLGALLLGESRERITAVAMQVGRELAQTDARDRDAMLERYSAAHGVTFRLFHQNGTQVGGPAVTLPSEVADHIGNLRAKSPLAEQPEMIVRMMQRDAAARAAGIPKEAGPLKGGQLDKLMAVIEDPPHFARDERGYWVTFRMPLRARDRPLFEPGELVMTSRSLFQTPFFFNLRPWLALAGVVLLIGLACWLPLVRGATRSITTLAAATAKIARGDFKTKVDVTRSDELGQLELSFNRMAAQLEGYVNGQKRFLRDAAHELRTPIARMQAALGNIQESQPGKEVEPLIEDIKEEIELMSSLTGELLAFAREENEQSKRIAGPLSLFTAVARAIATENPTGSPEVRNEVDPGMRVQAHPESLFRALSNVVRNAIRYAGDAGPIAVSAVEQNGFVTVTVSDWGPGIPEEALEMIFTPFYRLDVSRDRKTGGNGLGMAIVRSSIESCGGTVYCRNRQPGLAVIFTLKSASPAP